MQQKLRAALATSPASPPRHGGKWERVARGGRQPPNLPSVGNELAQPCPVPEPISRRWECLAQGSCWMLLDAGCNPFALVHRRARAARLPLPSPPYSWPSSPPLPGAKACYMQLAGIGRSGRAQAHAHDSNDEESDTAALVDGLAPPPKRNTRWQLLVGGGSGCLACLWGPLHAELAATPPGHI